MANGWDPTGKAGRNIPVLIAIGAAAAGALIYREIINRRRMAEEFRNVPPADPAAVAEQFAGIPLFPGAELDGDMTARIAKVPALMRRHLAMRAVDAIMRRLFSIPWSDLWAGSAFAGYRVPASPAEVMAWYDERLAAEGWAKREIPDRPLPRRFLDRHPGTHLTGSYERGEETLLVTVTQAGGEGPTHLGLHRGRRPATHMEPGLTPAPGTP